MDVGSRKILFKPGESPGLQDIPAVGGLCNQREPGSFFDCGQKLCGLPSESQNADIGSIALFLPAPVGLCGHVKENVGKAPADAGIGILSGF